MSSPDDDFDVNRYQAPSANDDLVTPTRVLDDDEQLARLIRRFRQQMHGLGGLWLVLGLLQCPAFLFLALGMPFDGVFSGLTELNICQIIIGILVIWTSLAVLTFCKWIRAVEMAICLCCGTLVAVLLAWANGAPLAWLLTFPIMLSWSAIAGIVQGVRLRRWARQLRDRGVALDAKPDELS